MTNGRDNNRLTWSGSALSYRLHAAPRVWACMYIFLGVLHATLEMARENDDKLISIGDCECICSLNLSRRLTLMPGHGFCPFMTDD